MDNPPNVNSSILWGVGLGEILYVFHNDNCLLQSCNDFDHSGKLGHLVNVGHFRQTDNYSIWTKPTQTRTQQKIRKTIGQIITNHDIRKGLDVLGLFYYICQFIFVRRRLSQKLHIVCLSFNNSSYHAESFTFSEVLDHVQQLSRRILSRLADFKYAKYLGPPVQLVFFFLLEVTQHGHGKLEFYSLKSASPSCLGFLIDNVYVKYDTYKEDDKGNVPKNYEHESKGQHCSS